MPVSECEEWLGRQVALWAVKAVTSGRTPGDGLAVRLGRIGRLSHAAVGAGDLQQFKQRRRAVSEGSVGLYASRESARTVNRVVQSVSSGSFELVNLQRITFINSLRIRARA